jgi:hypothetical protein
MTRLLLFLLALPMLAAAKWKVTLMSDEALEGLARAGVVRFRE